MRYMDVCLTLCLVCVCLVPAKIKRGVLSPVSEVPDGVRYHIDFGNLTLVLRRVAVFFTAEPYPQTHICYF